MGSRGRMQQWRGIHQINFYLCLVVCDVELHACWMIVLVNELVNTPCSSLVLQGDLVLIQRRMRRV